MDINTVVYHNCDICSALYPYSDDLYLGIVREILATDFFCPTSSSPSLAKENAFAAWFCCYRNRQNEFVMPHDGAAAAALVCLPVLNN